MDKTEDTSTLRDRHFAAGRPFEKRAGLLCGVGVLTGLISSYVNASVTPQVSLFAYSFPFTPRAFLLAQSALILNHLLLITGILGFARSGIAGGSAMAVWGFRFALAGLGLLTLCEVVAMGLVGQPYPSFRTTLLDGFFGLAMVLAAAGLTLAGTAGVRSRSKKAEPAQ